MPLIEQINTKEGAKILVWKDEEDLDFFRSQVRLNTEEEELLNRYNHERRKKDLLIARFLLQGELPEATIAYLESGKPYLKDEQGYISISHTKDIVSIILHPSCRVSIDIEYISTRVERLRNRFLSDKELSIASDTATMILFWSAKETLFKSDDDQGLDFREHLTLEHETANTLIGTIRQAAPITIKYQIFDSWVMTYAVIAN